MPEILDAIKKHGIVSVIAVSGFLYLNSRVGSLEEKYEECMVERINDAYRIPRTSQDKPERQRLYAVLVDPLTFKKKEREPNQ